MAITITLTPTNKQVTRLEKVLARVNAERTSFLPPAAPYATIDEWLQAMCHQLMRGYIQEQKEREDQAYKIAVAEATDAQRDQIAAILGVV